MSICFANVSPASRGTAMLATYTTDGEKIPAVFLPDALPEKFNWSMLRGTAAPVSISDGNKKLVSSPVTRFLIWSLPAVKTCPFRTAQCEHSCYARKAEKAYPDCLPAREKNLLFSRSPLFVPFMVRALHYVAALPAYRSAKHITVRIHESGDFYSVDYLEKWLDIAAACRDIPNMDFAAYTKSLPFLRVAASHGYDIHAANIRFVSSIWDDTAPARIEDTAALRLPIYTAFPAETWDASYTRCRCEDCGNCRHCFAGPDAVDRNAVVIH